MAELQTKEDYVEVNIDSSRPFLCTICWRHFSSKRNVFNHLHQVHRLSPVKRASKRYVEDDAVGIPASTQYRWKKLKFPDQPSTSVLATENLTSVENPDPSDQAGGGPHDIQDPDDVICDSDSECDFLSVYSDMDNDCYFSLDSEDDDSETEGTSAEESDSEDSSASITVESPALSLLSCFIRHNMSASACKDIISAIKKMCPDADPLQALSYEDIWKSVSTSAGQVKEFHYCLSCCTVFPNDPDIVHCQIDGCGGLRYKGTDQHKNGRQPRQKLVFADIRSQVRLLLEAPGVWRSIEEHKEELRRRMEMGDNTIGDIVDGVAYRRLCEGDDSLLSATNLSAVMNTDGMNLYSSSKVELWPIFLAINELHPASRFARENLLLAGIWQGKGKPPFQQYLTLFSKEMNDLQSNGIQISVGKKSFLVKLRVVCATVDLPAKASMLNMTYFNGASACITCEEIGHVVQQGRGHARCYPYRPQPVQYRTNEDILQCMRQATPTRRVKGFCGTSGLADMHGFDFVTGVVPDYMHAILLGVTKMLLCKWFSPTENDKPYFIGKDLPLISKKLLNINPPDFIERLPRDLEKNYCHFKATELQTWLLYYCIPCVSGILPQQYLTHIAKLSEAVHIFLGDCLTETAISHASDLLDDFYHDFEGLYGQGSCGLNIHNVGSHMSFYVKLWGPMWAWSCFAFEDANAMVLQSVHGTGDVVRQVLQFKLAQGVMRKSGLDQKSKRGWSKLKNMSNCEVAGKIKPFGDSVLERNLRSQIEGDLRKADRVIVPGHKKFYSVEYSRMKRRECCVIRTKDSQYGKVLLFAISNNSECAAVLQEFIVCESSDEQAGKHLVPVRLSCNIRIVPVQDLEENLVFISGGDVSYVSSAPNKLGRAVFK